MSIYGREAYLETEILEAEPLQLIRLLYQGAIKAVGQARRDLHAGRISDRSRQITRAMEIVAELDHVLDLEKGGSVAVNLSRLYDYMNHRLHDANFQQVEPPLVEVEQLLGTLSEAWEMCEEPHVPTATTAQTSSADSENPALQMWPMEDAYVGYSPQTIGR